MSVITVPRNDTRIFSITVQNDGSAVDITGWTVSFTVRTRDINGLTATTNDSGALIAKVVTSHTNAAAGLTAVTLSSTDTNVDPGKYVYDIQVKKPDNTIYSSIADDFIVVADVTRST